MIINTKSMKPKDMERLTRQKLSLFVLWMISDNPMHGYDIIKTIRDDPILVPMAANKIYPILADLAKKGFIAYKTEKQGKRAKKLYHITPKGKEVLKNMRAFMKRSPLVMRYVEEMLR